MFQLRIEGNCLKIILKILSLAFVFHTSIRIQFLYFSKVCEILLKINIFTIFTINNFPVHKYINFKWWKIMRIFFFCNTRHFNTEFAYFFCLILVLIYSKLKCLSGQIQVCWVIVLELLCIGSVRGSGEG